MALSLRYGPALTSIYDNWKYHTFGYMNFFCSKMMSLLSSTLSRFDIAFLLRSKGLLISWLQSPFTEILEPKKIKSVTVSPFSPVICYEVIGLYSMILVF